MRSKVSVTLGSSSTIRIVRVAAGVETARLDIADIFSHAALSAAYRFGSCRLCHPCYSRDFVSPILVRPVREQLEHDRIIRLLQTKFRRRFDVGINPGAEQNAPVGTGPPAVYPDVVLTSQDRGRKVHDGHRGGDGRVGQPPRSAGRMGHVWPAAARPFIFTCPTR